MNALAVCTLGLAMACVLTSAVARADAADCMTPGECAPDVSWDVHVGSTHTTVTIHHPDEDPIVETRPNDSTEKVSGHGVSVKPSNGGWSSVLNCQGTSYGCA